MGFFLLFHLLLAVVFSDQLPPTTSQTATSNCPLNFTILQNFLPTTTTKKCQYTLQAIHLLQSHLLRTTSLFLPPSNASSSCWLDLTTALSHTFPGFDPLADCGFSTPSISQGCLNITTPKDFESIVPSSELDDVRDDCKQLSINDATCSLCTATLGSIKAVYLNGSDNGNNVTDCASYPAVYAAGVVTASLDDDAVLCLFSLKSTAAGSGGSSSIRWVIGVVVGGVFLLVLGALICLWRRRKRRRRRKMVGDVHRKGGGVSVSQLETIRSHATLVRYTFDEIKSATNGLSVKNIIGRGGYGNVYRGVLPDGSEIAVKRFKNLSASGDESFAHEVEVIASVRHVNLLPLRGYCVSSSQRFAGHERILVCDLITNGSLHDHLFGDDDNGRRRKMSWPVRQKIAIGTARGITYLHHGAQPAIVHRDIKASNILLDDEFEPKVADFGLAKFTPEGASHLSTRVAGTLGYVAPEYALFGKLTDRSDVYSFGVLLLELVSGKKAIVEKMTGDGGEALMVADWAWELVKKGRAFDVIEEGMSELPLEKMVLEKYVRIGILCSHPHLQERPSMQQVLKLLETDLEVPVIGERPISLISNINDIERNSDAGSSGSSLLSGLIVQKTFTTTEEN